MKILIGMPENMVKDIQEICNREGYERSEFIRSCVRERIYKPKEKAGETRTMPLENIPEKIEEIIKKSSEKAIFCKKHHTMRIGESYSCGCE